MAWTALTTSSIKSAISNAEWTKYTQTSTGSLADTTIIDEQITQVTSMIRGYIAACPKNTLSSDSTLLPASLHYPAVSIIIYRIQQRIAGKLTDINEARVNEYENALKLLEKIMSCDMPVEIPSSPETTNSFEQPPDVSYDDLDINDYF